MIKNLHTMKNIAYSKSTVTDPNSKNIAVSFEKLMWLIKNPPQAQKDLIIKVRKATLESLNSGATKAAVSSDISADKKQLHFFIISGFQKSGHNNKEIVLNQLAQIDIDFKIYGGEKKALLVKEALKKLPYIKAAFISPSGVGVKAVVQSSQFTKELWNAQMKVLNKKIAEDLNLGIEWFDSLGCSQPSYISYDKDAYINKDAIEIPFTLTFSDSILRKSPKKSECSVSATSDTHEFKPVIDSLEKSNGFDTTMLQKGIPIFLSNAFDLESLVSYLKARYGSEFSSKRETSLRDMYSRYSSSLWGTNISVKSVAEKGTVITKYLSEKADFLNKLILDKKKVSVTAPTGSGKSEYVAKYFKGKKVLVVPSQNQVMQAQVAYNADVFFENEKTATEQSDLIVTTYNSFYLLTQKVDLKEFTVFFDEAHNFTVASSRNFWWYHMRSVAEWIDSAKNNIVLLTATPITTTELSVFSEFHKVVFSKPTTIKKTISCEVAADTMQALLQRVTKNKAENRLSVIQLQNTKEDGKLGKLKALLSGFNIATINSLTKETKQFSELIVDGKVDESVDVVFATTVIKEGLNITNHKKEVDIILLSTLHYVEIEQICARFRNAKTVSAIKFFPENAPALTNRKTFNLDKVLTAKEQVIENMKKAYTAAGISDGGYYQKAIQSAVEDVMACENDEFRVDELLLNNWVFNKEAQYCDKSFKYLTDNLSQYGWVVTAPSKNLETLESDKKSAVKKSVAETKKELLKTRTDYVNSVKTLFHSRESLESEYRNEKDKMKKAILGNALSLSNACENSIEEILEALVDTEFSESKIAALKKSLVFAQYADTKHYKATFSEYFESLKGGLHTPEELREGFVKFTTTNNTGISAENWTLNKINKFLKMAMDVNRTKNKENINVYSFSDKTLPLTPFKVVEKISLKFLFG